MGKVEIIGHVLWWSDRDGNGVICDLVGNEFYFDKSVLILKKNQKISRNQIIVFNGDKVNNVLVATKVFIPTSKSMPKYYKNSELDKIQLKLPFS